MCSRFWYNGSSSVMFRDSLSVNESATVAVLVRFVYCTVLAIARLDLGGIVGSEYQRPTPTWLKFRRLLFLCSPRDLSPLHSSSFTRHGTLLRGNGIALARGELTTRSGETEENFLETR